MFPSIFIKHLTNSIDNGNLINFSFADINMAYTSKKESTSNGTRHEQIQFNESGASAKNSCVKFQCFKENLLL
jgi:hypothetical protein